MAYTGPGMSYFARYENRLAGAQAKSLITNLKIKIPIYDIDPLILVIVEVARAAVLARELENAHRAICILGRQLAIVRFAAEFDVLTESVVLGGDDEALKQVFSLHLLYPL